MPKHAKAKVRRKVRREPVAVAALATVLVSLVALFGLDLDRELASAIATAVLALAAWWARSQVTPVADPRLPDDPAAVVRARNGGRGII